MSNEDTTAQEELGKALKRLWTLSKTRSSRDMGHLFLEYILESEYGGWEGFDDNQDLPAIAALINDIVTYGEHAGGLDPNKPATIFTGVEYLTTDRPE
jgi:hypothetical protein